MLLFKPDRKGILNLKPPAREEIVTDREEVRTVPMVEVQKAGEVIIKKEAL